MAAAVSYALQRGKSMVLTISDEEFVRMQTAALDGDKVVQCVELFE
jgi:hypothetical protein